MDPGVLFVTALACSAGLATFAAISLVSSGSFSLAGLPGWEKQARPALTRLLMAAGFPNGSPERIVAVASAAAVAGASAGAVAFGPLGALVLGAFSAAVPLGWLSARARKRADAIERHFPFAVDLLTLAVAGGMHVEWAFAKVHARLSEGPLKREWGQGLSEQAVGVDFAGMLRGLAARTGSETVGRAASAIIQAESTGMSLATLLDRLSDDLRRSRLAAAEARAQRAPVRMLFPILFCILPVVFLVLLGPILHRFFS